MHAQSPALPGVPVIRLATVADLDAVGRIRNDAIATSDALWTTIPEAPQTIREQFTPLIAAGRVFVATSLSAANPLENILGFADYMPLRAYNGYDETMEQSIYLTPAAQGRGIGTQLLSRLIDRARSDTVHSLVGNIAGNNAASIRMHEKLGFQTVGTIPEAGHKFDRWIDLIIMQLMVE